MGQVKACRNPTAGFTLQSSLTQRRENYLNSWVVMQKVCFLFIHIHN
ncbi:hypothetical protein EZS27_004547 [termite gut metagenome]|uniref:Uncharacterized protein n=1 Tax=termite gut metagenome TaxID=433724 RepID=A0A5J4SRX9_9ZZZZ